MAKVNRMKHVQVKIVSKKITDLKPHPRNPRKHPAEGTIEWDKLKRSLQSVYFDPIVINKTNGILVSGHLRTKVLSSMGCELVDCVEIEVDEKEHLALLMGANNQTGEFDFPKVTKILKELERNKSQFFFHGFHDDEVKDLVKGNFEVVVEDGPGGVPPGGTTPQVLVSKIQASKHVVHAMTPSEYERLRTSIKHTGILMPLLLRKIKAGLYEVIDGHQRWKAAIELGLQTVPAKVVAGCDEARALVMTIATNGIKGTFLPSEMGRHLGGLVNGKEITAKDLMEGAAMNKERVIQNTGPEHAKTGEVKKNFVVDERGIPTRQMREYVAGVDFAELKDGELEYIEFSMLLEKKDYESISEVLNHVNKDWSLAVKSVFDFYREHHKIEAPVKSKPVAKEAVVEPKKKKSKK